MNYWQSILRSMFKRIRQMAPPTDSGDAASSHLFFMMTSAWVSTQ